jgi:hypothetical protein
MVLLPLPEAPTIAVCFPFLNFKFRLSNTFTSGLVGYTKFTFSSMISSREDTAGDLIPCVGVDGASIIEKNIPADVAACAAPVIGEAMLDMDITIVIIEVKTLKM